MGVSLADLAAVTGHSRRAARKRWPTLGPIARRRRWLGHHVDELLWAAGLVLRHASSFRTPLTAIRGVPLSASRALDRLDRPSLSSARVRRDLLTWGDVARKPRSALTGENNDWVQFVGPLARDALERAMCALPRRHGASIRRQVTLLDRLFLEKTLNDPCADPSSAWWCRRL